MLLLAATIFFSAPTCPAAFSFTNTTIGAISDSKSLSLCVSKATLVSGTDGSVKLVINSSTAAPKCLVYPNGLSPDLAFDLLSSGHTGCWSLYPPSQPVTIVNVGKPSQAKITSALQSFKPQKPVIYLSPAQGVMLQDKVSLSSSAKSEIVRCNLFRLPCRVRFVPVAYSWNISGTKTKVAKPVWVAKSSGLHTVSLAITYSIEYSFDGLTPWTRVYPNILLSAPSRAFTVGEPNGRAPGKAPRLVNWLCDSRIRWGC